MYKIIWKERGLRIRNILNVLIGVWPKVVSSTQVRVLAPSKYKYIYYTSVSGEAATGGASKFHLEKVKPKPKQEQSESA